MVPVKNLGELRWYGSCHYTREWEMGTLMISQETFVDGVVKKFCVTFTQSVPLRVGVKLEEIDEDERVENWPFRELVGSLMWLSISLFCFTAGTLIPHASPSLQTGGGACEHPTVPFARPGVGTSAPYRGG